MAIRGRKPSPITIRGTTYASVKLAAADIGVTTSAINYANRRGTLDYVGTDKRAPRPGDRRGEGAGSNRGVPIQFGPYRFPSHTAASLALGMHTHYVRGVVLNGTPKQKKLLLQRVNKYVAQRKLNEQK